MSKKYISANKKVARYSLVAGILAFIGIFIPELIGMDGYNGGFALSFFCIFISLSAFLTAIVFWKYAKKEQKIREGENVLAKWSYSDKQWDKFTKLEYEIDRSYKKMLLKIIIFFALLFGIGFWVFDSENGIYVFYAMLGLIALMTGVAYYSIYAAHQKNLKHKGEITISTAGLIMNEQFMPFNAFGSKLKNVDYNKKLKPKYLEFELAYFTRTGEQSNFVRVPVPEKEEKNIDRILKEVRRYI